MTHSPDPLTKWLRARCPDSPDHRLRRGELRVCRSADKKDTMMLRHGGDGWILTTSRCVVHSDGAHRKAGETRYSLAGSIRDALSNYYTDEELKGYP